MKKKFLIILVLILVWVMLFVGTAFIVTHSSHKEIAKIQDEELAIDEELEEVNPDNEELAIEDVETEESNNTEEKHEEIIHTNENIASNINVNNKTTTIVKKDTQEKVIATTNETKQEKTSNKENPQKTNNTQVEQPAAKETSITQNKELEEIKEKLSCKDGKHYMDVGSSGKWFDTEDEAIAYYKSIIKEWGDKLESFDDYKSEEFKKFNEEYNKKCPCRYETSSCFCGKWTIDFEYRK